MRADRPLLASLPDSHTTSCHHILYTSYKMSPGMIEARCMPPGEFLTDDSQTVSLHGWKVHVWDLRERCGTFENGVGHAHLRAKWILDSILLGFHERCDTNQARTHGKNPSNLEDRRKLTNLGAWVQGWGLPQKHMILNSLCMMHKYSSLSFLGNVVGCLEFT